MVEVEAGCSDVAGSYGAIFGVWVLAGIKAEAVGGQTSSGRSGRAWWSRSLIPKDTDCVRGEIDFQPG